MDFLTWTKHLMKKDPIREEEETMVEYPRPRRGKREYPRFSFDAPLEYSSAAGSPTRGAYAGNASETGLLIYSIDHLQVGTELRLLVFYPDECRLDSFQAVAKVVWKQSHYEKDWKGFKYGLQFSRMSEMDREKLRKILNRALIQENDVWNRGADLYASSMEVTP